MDLKHILHSRIEFFFKEEKWKNKQSTQHNEIAFYKNKKKIRKKMQVKRISTTSQMVHYLSARATTFI
jgi:hypothetical protein